MKVIQYYNSDDRNRLHEENISQGYILIEEKNITSGKFMVFEYPDLIPIVVQEPTVVEVLQKEITLLKAQSKANADISDFHEELIVELAMMVYQ